MRKLLVFGALVAAAASAPAFAQDVTVTGNVTLTTDYVWRNVTQSNYDAAIQGGIDITTSNGFYVGTWASSIDFNDASDANIEVDLYGGYRFDLGGVAADVGVIYYAYPDTDDINFTEIYGKLSKTFDAVTLGGSLNWDPDNETTYADASIAFAGILAQRRLWRLPRGLRRVLRLQCWRFVGCGRRHARRALQRERHLGHGRKHRLLDRSLDVVPTGRAERPAAARHGKPPRPRGGFLRLRLWPLREARQAGQAVLTHRQT